ncbi:hypothetical protein TBS_33290 [Thermobispora bispora]
MPGLVGGDLGLLLQHDHLGAEPRHLSGDGEAEDAGADHPDLHVGRAGERLELTMPDILPQIPFRKDRILFTDRTSDPTRPRGAASARDGTGRSGANEVPRAAGIVPG